VEVLALTLEEDIPLVSHHSHEVIHRITPQLFPAIPVSIEGKSLELVLAAAIILEMDRGRE